ncbi:MAG: hypothetical protein MUF03_12730 [Rubrivivax sp.]|jgi:uncharacterized protein|nr:hypothetical protein [Rubrivivax sp.]
MPMLKLLLVLAVVVVAGMLFLGRRRGRDASPPVPGAPPPPAPRVSAEMVACAHCGVHLPATEARRDDAGRPYCGDAHRAAGPR